MYYTGAGDNGTSTIFNSKERLSKSSAIFELLGSLDELNSWLGLCVVEAAYFPEIKDILRDTQHSLFTVQAYFAQANIDFSVSILNRIEEEIKNLSLKIKERKSFILSGGCRLSALLDITRSIARRVERCAVRLSDKQPQKINPTVLAYLNRLSSLFYVLARLANDLSEVDEESPVYYK